MPTSERMASLKWPQFELWRLFVATGVFCTGMACLVVPQPRYDVNPVSSFVWLGGVMLLGASLGIPFKKGILFALCSPGWWGLIAVIKHFFFS